MSTEAPPKPLFKFGVPSGAGPQYAFGQGKTPMPKQRSNLQEQSGRGILLCLIGLPGIGKSSLLAQFPNCEFICDKRDQGILDLMDYSETTGIKLSRSDVTICSNYPTFLGTVQGAIEGPKSTIILESLIGIQSLCDDYTMSYAYDHPTNPKAANRFVNYREGYRISANVHFQAILDEMLKGQNAGKNMILTGHSKVGLGKSVTTEDWVSQVLNNEPEFSRRIDATFATILHIGQSLNTIKPGSKIRAEGDFVNNIYTEINPLFPAKNRMGLHGTIDYPITPQLAFLGLCNALRLNPRTGMRL